VQQEHGTAAARLAFVVSEKTGLLMSWCCLSAACNLLMQLALHTIMREEHTHLVQPGPGSVSAMLLRLAGALHASVMASASCSSCRHAVFQHRAQWPSANSEGPCACSQAATGWYASRIMQASNACDQVSFPAPRLTHIVVLLCLLCLPAGWQDRVPRVWCGHW
jgi:hypothetical protein